MKASPSQPQHLKADQHIDFSIRTSAGKQPLLVREIVVFKGAGLGLSPITAVVLWQISKRISRNASDPPEPQWSTIEFNLQESETHKILHC